MSKRVTTLPPTIGIKDPEVRQFLDALVNAWDHRSGNTDAGSPDRFITAEEFEKLASNSIAGVFADAMSGAGIGTGTGSGGQATTVADMIRSLSDEIKRSLLYQLLGTEYGSIDVSSLQARVNAAFNNANTLFLQEKTERESQYESMTEQINIQASRIQASEAAIVSEATTRTNKDNALASAINTMWAKIGGSAAVIQDGQLASVTPSAVQATKWDQVQVALRDPNTGTVSSTSIKQELNSYINSADGKFNSIYSVRAEITQDGRTIVGGFGLAAVGGANGGQGPSIDFGVRADKFWVGSPSGVGDIPFIIQGGNTYIKTAFIADATIDTLKLTGGSVTSMSYGNTSNRNVGAGSEIVACQATVNMAANASGVVVTATATCGPVGSDSATGWLTLRRTNGTMIGFTAFSMIGGSQFSACVTGFDPTPQPGLNTYLLIVGNPTGGPGANTAMYVQVASITATGGKR